MEKKNEFVAIFCCINAIWNQMRGEKCRRRVIFHDAQFHQSNTLLKVNRFLS